MARPGLVIFDCDGILVDTETIANRRLSAMLTQAGFAADYGHCRRFFSGRSMRSVQEEVEAAGVDLGADFIQRWNDGLPGLFAGGVEEIPHVRGVVDILLETATPYCVASSAGVGKMHLTLGMTGLLPYFEGRLFSSSMVARGKPFPDLFLHAASTMGFAPHDCIVIEDSVPGTKAGVAAGMAVFSYCGDPHADRDALATAGGIPFGDMRELPALAGLM